MTRPRSLFLVLSVLSAALVAFGFYISRTDVPDAPRLGSQGDEASIEIDSSMASGTLSENGKSIAETGTTTPDEAAKRRERSPCATGSREDRSECLGQRFMTRFEAEDIDRDWAYGTASAIMGGLSQLGALATVTSIGAECRETLCRLRVAFTSVEDLQRIIAEPAPGETNTFLSEYINPMQRQAGVGGMVPYPREIELPVRTWYLSRR